MSEKEITAEDRFHNWLGWLLDMNQVSRYAGAQRDEHIAVLCSQLKAGGVPFDEAKFLKSKVIEALTTREGRKNVGQYKGWKDTVDISFKAILANYYIEDVELDEVDDNRTSSSSSSKSTQLKSEPNRYHPDNSVITEWTKDKWGQDWTPALCREAHLVGGSLNSKFKEEVFESDWILNPDTYPVWYKKACDAS